MSPRWNVEIGLSGDSLDVKSDNGEHKQTEISLDGLYFFHRTGCFAPYGVIGAGGLRTKLGGNSDTSLMFQAGLGFLSPLTPSLGLRVDVRYRWDDNAGSLRNENDFGDWLMTAGFRFLSVAALLPRRPRLPQPPRPRRPLPALRRMTAMATASPTTATAAPAHRPA